MKCLLKYLIQPYNLLSLFVLFFILHPNKDSPLSPLSTSSPPQFTPPLLTPQIQEGLPWISASLDTPSCSETKHFLFN